MDRFWKEEGEYLDGGKDETNANWLCPGPGSTAEEALKEYVAIKASIAAQSPNFKVYHAEKYSKYGSPSFQLRKREIDEELSKYFSPSQIEGLCNEDIYVAAITMIRVPPDTVIGEEKKEELKLLCEENSVHIIYEKEKWIFQDLLFHRVYALRMIEYPGSADDAATYGSVHLI